MSWLARLAGRVFPGGPGVPRHKLHAIRFRRLAEDLRSLVELCDQATDKLAGQWVIDRRYVASFAQQSLDLGREIVFDSGVLVGAGQPSAYASLDRVRADLNGLLAPPGRGAAATPPAVVVGLGQGEGAADQTMGEPARRLRELARRLAVPVPDGFVITGTALAQHLAGGGLDAELLRLHSAWRAGRGAPQDSANLRDALRRAELPAETRRAVDEAALTAAGGGGCFSLYPAPLGGPRAGIPDEWGLALQDVAPENVAASYCRLVAELLTSPELGSPPLASDGAPEWPAVTCVGGPPSRSRGLVLTCDPEDPTAMRIEVRAGRVRQLHAAKRHPANGAEPGSLPADLVPLARTALITERFAGRPQALAWVRGEAGFWVVQCADIALSAAARPSGADLAAALDRHERIFCAPDSVAVAGFAVGVVWRGPSASTATGHPRPPVLVLGGDCQDLPVPILRGAAALLVADRCTEGTWLAAARDWRVPVLVGLGSAVASLRDGEPVTVDAQEGAVYRGVVAELALYHLAEPPCFQGEPEYRLLRSAIRRVAPPSPGTHAPGQAASGPPRLFDVVAEAHERALRSFETLRYRSWGRPAGALLEGSRFPGAIRVVDAGGGIAPGEDQHRRGALAWQAIRSEPLRALLEPLAAGGLQSSSSAGSHASTLAIVTEERVVLDVAWPGGTLLLDACLGEHASANYVYCVFRGLRRESAPRSLRDIVTRGGFRLLDLGAGLTGWVSGRASHETRQVLGPLGRSIRELLATAPGDSRAEGREESESGGWRQ